MCFGPKTFHHDSVSPRIQVGWVDTFRKVRLLLWIKVVCPLLTPPQTTGSCLFWDLPGSGPTLPLPVTQLLSEEKMATGQISVK